MRIEKTVSEVYKVKVNFARVLEYVWRPGYDYQANEQIRPTTPNGYEYQTAAAGQSGDKEPNFKRAANAGATIKDGSITWTASVANGSASDSIALQSVTEPSGELTIGPVTVEGTEVVFTVSAGLRGHDYELSVEITTSSGEVFEEKPIVSVRGD